MFEQIFSIVRFHFRISAPDVRDNLLRWETMLWVLQSSHLLLPYSSKVVVFSSEISFRRARNISIKSYWSVLHSSRTLNEKKRMFRDAHTRSFSSVSYCSSQCAYFSWYLVSPKSIVINLFIIMFLYFVCLPLVLCCCSFHQNTSIQN